MILSFIVAVSDNHAIGRDNQLPWHLPEDLKFFKRTTLGKPVIMGRKTYESLGKPLPGRLNIVLSRQEGILMPEGVLTYKNVEDAMALLRENGTEEAFIIGGGKIFAQTMAMADRLYVTQVHTTLQDGDVFFEPIDHTHWKLVWEERNEADERHAYPFTFQQYERIEL